MPGQCARFTTSTPSTEPTLDKGQFKSCRTMFEVWRVVFGGGVHNLDCAGLHFAHHDLRWGQNVSLQFARQPNPPRLRDRQPHPIFFNKNIRPMDAVRCDLALVRHARNPIFYAMPGARRAVNTPLTLPLGRLCIMQT